MEEKDLAGSSDGKLSNEEFKKLIPHLELNQQFLIEIFKDGEWKNLFSVQKDKIYCNVCNPSLPVKGFKRHLAWTYHGNSLQKVIKFYHPLYTSNQDRDDLNDADKEKKIREANAIADRIEQQQKNAINGSFKITLPIEDILNIEFQKTKTANWQKLLSSKGPTRGSGKYTCHVCDINCDGIITVNEHFRGYTHRTAQRAIHGLRSPKNENVSKSTQIWVNLENFAHQNEIGQFVKNTNMKNLDNHIKKEKKMNAAPSKSDEREGLIGVEYVAELRCNSGHTKFACCLCNFLIVPTEQLMQNHLVSFKHRMKYCKEHYSDTIEHFDRLIKSTKVLVKYSVSKAFVLFKIARGIEDYHGYGKPYVTTYDKFLRDKEKIGDEVEGLPHACQEFGPSFSNVATAKDLLELIKVGAKTNSYSKVERPRFMVPPQGKHYLNMPIHVSRPIKKKKKADSVGEHHSRSHKSISPHSRKRKMSSASGGQHINDSSDVWSNYRFLISNAAAELEGDYLDYRKYPEKHPNYDKEWSSFWKRRKTELQDEGIDYRSYDFQPEWTTYFRQRLEELFGEELQKSKIQVRLQLNIPLEAEEDSELPRPERTVELPPYKKLQLISREDNKQSESMNWNSRPQEIWNPPQKKMEDKKPNVIHMLRLMTALEEHLGSMGGKILDLLTEAISLEKVYAGDLEKLEQRILTSKNCKLLRAAQEKLRCQLYADLVEDKKINSFNKVVECSEFLLNRADEMGWSTASFEEPSTSSSNVQIEKLLEVVLQDKSNNEFSGSKNKSLPDTLMELMSHKKDVSEIRPSNFNKPLNYGNNRNNVGYPPALATQNTSFQQQNSFPSNNLRGGFNLSRPNLNFQNTSQQGLNSTIWKRLDGNSNFSQQQNHQPNFNNNFMGPNRNAPNTYGPNGNYGSGYNNSFNY